MKSITAKCTIEKCRKIFSRFDIPQILVTDNGRTFISQEFQDFIETNRIIYKRTAPYHPATNGLMESFVQTLKQGLRKVKLTKDMIEENVQKFLFHYRITPIPELKRSPAEIMFGRKLRSRLDLIFPKELITMINLKCDDETRNFQIGDNIAAREYLNKKIKWRFGTVVRKLGKLHYLIKLENGKIWKRHINQLRSDKSKNTEIVKAREELDVACNRDNAVDIPTEEETEKNAPKKISAEQEKESRQNVNVRLRRRRLELAYFKDYLVSY